LYSIVRHNGNISQSEAVNHHRLTLSNVVSKTAYFTCADAETKLKLEGCIVLNEHNTVFGQNDPMYATGVSLGPPVVDANGISIASAVSAGLTRWKTDWQTDRSRYSVGNNSQSAQWRSQIMLLSMANNKYLLEQSTWQIESTSYSNQQLYLAVWLDGLCMWRHTTI